MNTLELRALQVLFLDYLRDLPSTIKHEIVSDGHASTVQRMKIYHGDYHERLLKKLQDTYEKTWIYLGDHTFRTSALAFIAEHPSQQPNLSCYGAEFPHWLNHQFPEDGDIAELAHIDWQLRKAFDGQNSRAIQAAELSGLSTADWETIGFRFTPTLYIAPQHFNSSNIWHTLDRGLTPPLAETLTEPSWLLVWRKGWQPHFRTIQNIEFTALSQLHHGMLFAEVCEDLIRQFSNTEATTVAADCLQKWLQDELIIGLSVTH